MDNVCLSDIDPSEIPFIPGQKQMLEARVVDVYDGDTCTVIYLYKNTCYKTKIRILGIDTPEVCIRGISKGTELGKLESKAGKYVRDKVKELIDGKIVNIKIDKFDKYGGRVNGEVFLLPENYSLTDWLLEKRYAKIYFGKKKEDWNDQELKYILEN